jgi:curved DNA-binding protein CbpA
MIAPSRGCWWNVNEGKWVKTNLLDEERWINKEPEYDEDILGDNVVPEEKRPKSKEGGEMVKDTYYYDKLGLDPSVDSDMIKRRYFIIARKFSPDRAGAKNPQAQQEFAEIGRAYTILMNPDLRAKYDRVGRDMLWQEEEEPPEVDPFMLYTLLFGSEKFNDYIGRLAAVTSIRVGDESQSKITLAKARLLQKRRVTRLALKLAERLQAWAEDGLKDQARADWTAEAEKLCDASYGVELVRVIGQVYTLSAVQFLGKSTSKGLCSWFLLMRKSIYISHFLSRCFSSPLHVGSFDSGLGMPSISSWAKKQSEGLKIGTRKIRKGVEEIGGNKDKISLHHNVGTAVEKSEGHADLKKVAMGVLKKSELQQSALDLLWQQTVVDITR